MNDLVTQVDLLTQFREFFMRHYMMCGAWIVVVVLLIAVQFKLLVARVKKLSCQDAILLVNKQEGLFVDVRSVESFLPSHIANSINVTFSEIKEQKVQRIEKNRQKPIIIVGKDKFDTDAFNASRDLKKLGFSQVFMLDGGILEWSSNNLPLSNKK